MKNLFLIIVLSLFLLQSCNNKKKEESFTPVVLSNTNNKASCVRFTPDENNNSVLSWCEKDANDKKYFFLSFYDKNKHAFSAPVSIPIEQNAGIHEEGAPKIAVKTNGTIIAVYETSAPTKEDGWAGFVHYIQSFDKGKSWTQPLCVHADTSRGKEHSFASLTRLSDGEIGACWLDVSLGNKKAGRSVKFAETNGSNGFGRERLVDSFACECCRTAISSDNKGAISIAFRDLISNSVRDIAVSTSADNGNTFSSAVSFSNDDWVMNGCPHNGPSIANTNKNICAAWFTGSAQRGVYFAK